MTGIFIILGGCAVFALALAWLERVRAAERLYAFAFHRLPTNSADEGRVASKDELLDVGETQEVPGTTTSES